MMMQTYTDFKKMERFMWINRGDVNHLNDLLFTQSRDYLIKYNGQKVHISVRISQFVCIFSFLNVITHQYMVACIFFLF